MSLEDFIKKYGEGSADYVGKLQEKERRKISLIFKIVFELELADRINTFYSGINRAVFYDVASGGRHVYTEYVFGSKTLVELTEGLTEFIESIKETNSPISVRKYPEVTQDDLGRFECFIRLVLLDPTGTARKDGLFQTVDSF